MELPSQELGGLIRARPEIKKTQPVKVFDFIDHIK
jgi:hypothetical protein